MQTWNRDTSVWRPGIVGSCPCLSTVACTGAEVYRGSRGEFRRRRIGSGSAAEGGGGRNVRVGGVGGHNVKPRAEFSAIGGLELHESDSTFEDAKASNTVRTDVGVDNSRAGLKGKNVSYHRKITVQDVGIRESIVNQDCAKKGTISRTHELKGRGESELSWIRALELALTNPTPKSFTVAIGICGQAGQFHAIKRLWKLIEDEQQGLSLLNPLQEKQQQPVLVGDSFTFSAMITAFVRCGEWRTGIKVFESMRSHSGIRSQQATVPDTVVYNAAIDAYCKGNNPQAAIKLLIDMRERFLELSVTTFNTVIEACARQKERFWHSALDTMRAMEDSGMKMNTRTFNAAFRACSEHPEVSKGLLEKMELMGIPKDTITFTQLFKSNIPESVDEIDNILEEMYSKSVRLDMICFNTMIQCLGNMGAWESAVRRIRKNVKIEGIPGSEGCPPGIPDAYTHSTIISSISRAGNWRQALEYFEMIRNNPEIGIRDGRNRSTVSTAVCNCAIKACISGRSWKRSLEVLNFMDHDDIAVTVGTLRALLPSSREKTIDLDDIAHSSIVEALIERGTEFDAESVDLILRTNSHSGSWERMIWLIKRIKTKAPFNEVYKNVMWPNLVELISALTRRGDLGSVKHLLASIKCDTEGYNAAIRACMPDTKRQKAIRAYYELNREGFEKVLDYPNRWNRRNAGQLRWDQSASIDDSFEMLEEQIQYHASSLRWLRVFELMMKAKDSSKEPSTQTKNRALYAYAKTGQWTLALSLTRSMQHKGEANAESFGCLLASCDLSGKWRRTVDLFNKLSGGARNVDRNDSKHFVPTALMYSAAIRSHEKLGQRLKALELYSEMGRRSLRSQ